MFAVEDLGIGADQAHMRIGFEAGHLTGQLFGPPQVVAVQKGHIAAPAPGDGQIAGRAQGHGLFAAKIAQAAGQPGMAPGYLRAAVRGAVVPEDDLEIGEGLGGQAVQGLLQMFGAVQAVHDDGDHGGLGHGDMMHVFICENTPNGILTGVYDAWELKIQERCSHADIYLVSSQPDNYELFCDYHTVAPSAEKAGKVVSTLNRKLGHDFYETILTAILSIDLSGKKKMDKANAVYQTIVAALYSPKGARVLDSLSNPYIYRVFELSRATASEAHHLKGFLRFSELQNGVLFSTIHPKNNALPILAEHFTDRFPQENFMIYDETHQLAAVHRVRKNYMLVDASDINTELLQNYSENEARFQKLWLAFFDSIAIEARANPELQAQNIPKRFWKDAVELRHFCE